MLCHLEGYTHAEAASVLACPTGTVSVRVSRGRELLRQRLARRGLAFSTLLAASALASERAAAAMPAALAEKTIKAAIIHAAVRRAAAGTVSAEVTHLAEGVLRTMNLTRIATSTALIFTAVGVTSGVGLLVTGRPRVKAQVSASPTQDPPADKDNSGDEKTKEKKSREQTENHFGLIALGMHNFIAQSDAKRLPPAAIRSKDGKPLLSWRVAILPWVEQNALYEKFHLDEPWDSPHNKTLLKEIPDVYAPAVRGAEPRISTYYQVFTGPGTLFEDKLGTKIDDVKDGMANTVMVVEAGTPVPWTKPEDIEYDKDKPLPKLGGQFRDGFFSVFADGTPHFLRTSVDAQVMRAVITYNGGEAFLLDALANPPGANPDQPLEAQTSATPRKED